MTMDICEAFLHEPKDGQFHFAGKSSKPFGNLKDNLEAAAFGQSADIPRYGRAQSFFIQQRRMEEGRSRPNFTGQLMHQVASFFRGFGKFRSFFLSFAAERRQMHGEGS